MTKLKFKQITDHIWKYREYFYGDSQFDFPFYGGLKTRMGCCSPEAVDAMQIIWPDITNGSFKKKRGFVKAYEKKLLVLGEGIK